MKLKFRVAAALCTVSGICLFVTFKLVSKLDDGFKVVPGETDVIEVQEKTSMSPPLLHLSPTINTTHHETNNPWEVWSSHITPSTLYPIKSFLSKDMNNILVALSTYRITKFDVGHKGTQLKAKMILEGDQWTVFKPKRFVHTKILCAYCTCMSMCAIDFHEMLLLMALLILMLVMIDIMEKLPRFIWMGVLEN